MIGLLQPGRRRWPQRTAAQVVATFLAAALCAVASAEEPAQAPTATMVYVTMGYEEPPPLSLLERPLKDAGLLGARLSLRDANLTAGLLGKSLALKELIADSREVLLEGVQTALANGERLFIGDLEADELLQLADLPAAQDAMIFNIRASDDRLRNEDCRGNLYHLIPSRAMRADAIAQYLVWKKWRRWLLVTGKQPQDQAFAEAVQRAAERFGAKIVAQRRYRLETGSRRVETGYQQIQTQMPMLTRNAPDHDVIVVADERESFGLYLPYRSTRPRPVVGTYGMVAGAWHRSYEQYGAMALQSSFDEYAARHMTERDHLAWLALKLVTDAALRSQDTTFEGISGYIRDPDYRLAGYKGRPMSFREWNHQLRQPLLLHGDRALVSVAPIDGYLHQNHDTDTLGYDAPDSTCQFNDGEE